MGGGKNKLMPPAVAKNHLSPSINLTIAGAIGSVSSSLCWSFLHHFHLGGADFNWAHQAARDLLAGRNPYATTPRGIIPYPLPAALAALPFASFAPEVAAALFFGISSAFLALGIVRKDPMRLLIFLAYPYWSALMTAQWTPLNYVRRILPVSLRHVRGKAPDWSAHHFHALVPTRIIGRSRFAACEPNTATAVAMGMDFPSERVHLFRALAGDTRSFVGLLVVAMA
jgi:hypothetical protein